MASIELSVVGQNRSQFERKKIFCALLGCFKRIYDIRDQLEIEPNLSRKSFALRVYLLLD